MSCSVFTYGTLEIPDVMEAVTGRSFDSVEATADGYARFLLKGRIYPGMTPVSGHTTSGRVYFEVDERSLLLLDQFEDDVYVRQLISVHTAAANWLNAYAYIIDPKDKDVLTANPWSKETFAAKHLSSYLAACRGFHRTTTNCSLHIQSSNF